MIHLASQSPRRRELLRQIGVSFETVLAPVDEAWEAGEAPADYVLRLAREKAAAGLAHAPGASLVLGADTAVVLQGRVLGKAEDEGQAREMLRALSGRTHEVMTAVALAGSWAGESLSISRVRFRPLSAWEIGAYCATGEPLGKAGGYAIQGLGAIFVEHLEGSYSGVMGLPLYETARLLEEAGYPVLNVRRLLN